MNEEEKEDTESSHEISTNSEPIFKEMSYGVYGNHLESTLKLLTASKSICLIDKKDPKSKRMFITA